MKERIMILESGDEMRQKKLDHDSFNLVFQKLMQFVGPSEFIHSYLAFGYVDFFTIKKDFQFYIPSSPLFLTSGIIKKKGWKPFRRKRKKLVINSNLKSLFST